jgi:hypothetical protein
MKLPAGGHESCPLAVMGSARHFVVCLAASSRLRPLPRVWWRCLGAVTRGRDKLKSAEEIMEILEAFDLTGSLRAAAELAGVSHHTVARYVAAREAGGRVETPAARPQVVDEFLPKVEEWVARSRGKVRADVVHEKLLVLGYTGSERTTRRGCCGAGRVQGGAGAGAPAVGERAGDVVAVRLRRRPGLPNACSRVTARS